VRPAVLARHETENAVSSGRAPDVPGLRPTLVPDNIRPSDHLRDHRRADDPH
jgi:hypothetical protein